MFLKKKKENNLNVHLKEITQTMNYYAIIRKNGLGFYMLTHSNVSDHICG